MSESGPTRSARTLSRSAGRRAGIRPRPQLFGRVVRRSTWLHRVPTGWKLAVIAVIGLVALIYRDGIVNWSIFAVLTVLGFSARLPLRRFLIRGRMRRSSSPSSWDSNTSSARSRLG